MVLKVVKMYAYLLLFLITNYRVHPIHDIGVFHVFHVNRYVNMERMNNAIALHCKVLDFRRHILLDSTTRIAWLRRKD